MIEVFNGRLRLVFTVAVLACAGLAWFLFSSHEEGLPEARDAVSEASEVASLLRGAEDVEPPVRVEVGRIEARAEERGVLRHGEYGTASLTVSFGGARLSQALPVCVSFLDASAICLSKQGIDVADDVRVKIPEGAALARAETLGSVRGAATLEPGVDAMITLTLKELVIVDVEVVEAETGIPIADAEVWVMPVLEDGRTRRFLECGGAGAGRVTVPSNSMLTAAAKGYCAAPGVVVTQRHNGDSLTLRCVVARDSVRVTVADEAGRAVEGATVIVGQRGSVLGHYDDVRQEQMWEVLHVEGVSDSNGVCVLRGNWAGQQVPVSCSVAGMASQVKMLSFADESRGRVTSADVAFQMNAGVRIEGVLQGEGGQPVADVRVWLDYGGWSRRWCRSNASGRFSFEKCSPDSAHEVLVDSAGWRRRKVAVPSGSGLVKVDLVQGR